MEECTKCRAKVKLHRCGKSIRATFVVEGVDKKNWCLMAFNDKVVAIVSDESGSAVRACYEVQYECCDGCIQSNYGSCTCCFVVEMLCELDIFRVACELKIWLSNCADEFYCVDYELHLLVSDVMSLVVQISSVVPGLSVQTPRLHMQHAVLDLAFCAYSVSRLLFQQRGVLSRIPFYV